MKKLNKLFSILLVFVLGLFLASNINVKAEPVIATIQYTGDQNGNTIKSGDITSYLTISEENITVIYKQGTGTNSIFNNESSEIRLYVNGELQISVDNALIKSVSFNTSRNNGVLINGEKTTDKTVEKTFDLGVESLSIKADGAQVRMGAITITYQVAQEPLIESIDGASIRTEGTQGLRFYAKVTENYTDEEKGFYLMFGDATVADLETGISNGMKDSKDKTIIKVPVPGVGIDGEYSVVLTGIPEKGYLDDITVIPYAKLENSEKEIYASPVTRSVGEVAINMEKANQTMPDGIKTALANFTKVRFVGDNLEISKGLKDSEDEYVDFELYDIYHPEIEEIILPDFDGNEAFLGWYEDAEFNVGPVTSIDPLDITEDLILYAKWVEESQAPEVRTEKFTNLGLSGTAYSAGTFKSEHDENVIWEYSGSAAGNPGIKFGAKTSDNSYLKANLNDGISKIKITYTKPHTNGQIFQVFINNVLIGEFSNANGGGVFEKTLDTAISETYLLEIKPKSTTSSRRQVTITEIEWTTNP